MAQNNRRWGLRRFLISLGLLEDPDDKRVGPLPRSVLLYLVLIVVLVAVGLLVTRR